MAFLSADVPSAAFFRGGLALSALDFVERLAPFTEPRLLVRETAPYEAAVNHTAAQAETAARADKPKSALEMLTQ